MRMDFATLAVAMMLVSTSASATLRYVTPTATDSAGIGVCSVGTPCTLKGAALVVNAGDTVLVSDGNYYSTKSPQSKTSYVVEMNRGGNSTSGKVTWKSVNRWGAKISGRGDGDYNGIKVTADYVRIEGFDITEFREIGVYNASSDFFDLIGNHIHHIARNYCCSATDDPPCSIGKDGYFSNVTSGGTLISDVLIKGNQFNDIGRKVSGEGGCVAALPHNDHALYMSGKNITVVNNIFYNIRSGWGVHLYPDGSVNVLIAGNTFGGYIQDGTSAAQIIVWPACAGLFIKNNIFYQTRNNLVHMGNSTTTGEFMNNLTDLDITVAETVNGGPKRIFDIAQPGVVISGNKLNINPQLDSVVVSNGVLTGTPNLHIKNTSPAINGGLDLAGITTDFEGNLRPQGVAYDIGAYENQCGPPSTVAPAPIITSAASAGDGLSATISFTSLGAAKTAYSFRISLSAITAENFDQTTSRSDGVPIPQVCVASEEFVLTNICPGKNYYIAIKARNAFGWSAISNVVVLITSGVNDPQCVQGID